MLITGLKDHKEQLADGTVHNSNAAGTVADLLAEDRGLLHKTLNYLDAVQQPLIDQQDQLQDYLKKVPTALKMMGRAIGYRDFVKVYACDITLKINGLQPAVRFAPSGCSSSRQVGARRNENIGTPPNRSASV